MQVIAVHVNVPIDINTAAPYRSFSPGLFQIWAVIFTCRSEWVPFRAPTLFEIIHKQEFYLQFSD